MIKSDKGAILTVVIMVIVLLTLLAGYTLNFAYNQKRLTDRSSGAHLKAYYRAQAGVVDAQWRLRTDPGGLFAANGPAYNPPAYSLDIDGDGVNDVTVDIGATTAQGRLIESIGRDT